MKGTAILFQEQNVMFIEDVDYTVFEEIKKQCGCEDCTCRLQNKLVNFGSVAPIFWHENDVDWDYGY
jgi:hypothetical protein